MYWADLTPTLILKPFCIHQPHICLHKLQEGHQDCHIQQGWQPSDMHRYQTKVVNKVIEPDSKDEQLNSIEGVRACGFASIGSSNVASNNQLFNPPNTTFCRVSMSGDMVYTGFFNATLRFIGKRAESSSLNENS